VTASEVAARMQSGAPAFDQIAAIVVDSADGRFSKK
jgi:hypothetical protein